MYYPDLTPYEYSKDNNTDKLLNIGWLDEEHSFPTGKVEERILDQIKKLCIPAINVMRGFHQCQFCLDHPMGIKIYVKGKEFYLGCAEIRVKGALGKTYAAPNLIYHYIKDHNYLPPKEFLDAVEQTIIDPPSFMSRLKKRILNLLRIQN